MFSVIRLYWYTIKYGSTPPVVFVQTTSWFWSVFCEVWNKAPSSYLPARYTGCCCCYCPRRHRCIRSEAWQTVRFYTARGHRRPAGRLDITRFDDVLGNITSHTEWCYGTTDTIDYRRQRLGVETFMYSQCVTDRQTDSETASEHQASEDEDGTGGDGHFSLRSGTLPPFDSSPSWSHLGSQCSRIRIFRVFQISKKTWLFTFFLKWRFKRT